MTNSRSWVSPSRATGLGLLEGLARTSLLLLFGTAGWLLQLNAQTAENVLLLVNESSEASRTIAGYYAQKRNLPEQNVCSLRVAEHAAISRADFEQNILKPAADCLRMRGLQDQILYIVTTLGLPLVVEGEDGPTGTLATVDSELTLLYAYLLTGRRPGLGKMENSFFEFRFDPETLSPFDRRHYDTYLVSRLAGASTLEALLAIDRGLIATERVGGFFFDLPAQRENDQAEWVRDAEKNLASRGFQVLVEDTSAIPEVSAALGYAAWTSDDFAESTVRWKPGGLALALSTATSTGSAVNLELDRTLAPGSTGFGGFVADPGQDGLFRPQTLFLAYVSGSNLVESYYRALRYVGWRQLIAGDPLVSPFARKNAAANLLAGCERDDATGLPGCFARRRREFVMNRYSSGKEAVDLLLGGERMAAQGDLAGARKAFEESLEKNSLIPDTHSLLATILEDAGEFDEAFRHYEAALDLSGTDAELNRKLALLAFHRLQDPQRARPYALWLYGKVGSDNLEVARLWAEVNWALGNFRETEAVYNRLIELSPTPPAFAYAGLGEIHSRKGDLLRAEKFLQRALEVAEEKPGEPNQIDLAVVRGHFLEVRRQISGEKPDSEVELISDPVIAPPDPTFPEQVVEARVVRRTPTRYPEAARQQGIEGVVVLSVLLDQFGQFVKADIKHGHPLLAGAAKDAVQSWLYEPRLVNGKRIAGRLTLVLRFALTPGESNRKTNDRPESI